MFLARQVRDVDHLPAFGRRAREALPKAQPGTLQGIGAEAKSRGEFERVLRIQQQDVRGVSHEFRRYLAEDHRKSQMQVEAGGDRQVDGPQGGHALELGLDLFLGLFMPRGIPDHHDDLILGRLHQACLEPAQDACLAGRILEGDRLLLALDLHQGGSQAGRQISRQHVFQLLPDQCLSRGE